MSRSSKNRWLEAALPWMVSALFHAGVGLVAIFVVYLMSARLDLANQGRPIIVPNAFDDPAFAEHPGTAAPGSGSDPLHQEGLKDIARSEGWGPSNASNVASLLGGPNDAVGIFAGSGASVTPGQGNSAAALGMPGAGAGAAPRTSFLGNSGNATKIVYIVDHSGSMIDNFGFLKGEMRNSVNKLSANQFFAVLLVSDHVTAVGPAQLRRALPDSKKDFGGLLEKEVAEGANDGLLDPFVDAFKRAFAMDPDLVYFLTDGKFGEGLIVRVGELNKDKRVHINTIAFVTEEPAYKGQLQQLAQENGGTYKFVPQREVGN